MWPDGNGWTNKEKRTLCFECLKRIISCELKIVFTPQISPAALAWKKRISVMQ